MSAVSVEKGCAETAAYGGLVDAVGGIAAGVLGAAFLVQTGSILSEYSRLSYEAGAASALVDLSGGDGLAAMFLVGAGGMVLGVLALLGIASAALTAIAVIAFGSALVLSSTSVRQLYQTRGQALISARSGQEPLAGQMASGSAGVQLLTGLAAVVLGILAVAGHNERVLTLAALLMLGVTVLLSGSALSGMVLSFVRPGRGSSTGRRSIG